VNMLKQEMRFVPFELILKVYEYFIARSTSWCNREYCFWRSKPVWLRIWWSNIIIRKYLIRDTNACSNINI
jgi:hypothetical protein